jgi:hypothetical protein
MARDRFERCEACTIRTRMLELLPWSSDRPKPPQGVSPEQFWEYVSRAGLLSQALTLYDQVAAKLREWAHTRLETVDNFWARVEGEGRRKEAELAQAELLQSGLCRREAQEQLVAKFQPLDGTKARAWPTPNSWEQGRMCRSIATMNADKLTPDALQALMRHKSYQTTQVYINLGRQMDAAVASLHVPEVLRQQTA